jgi:hypothetical protein
MTNPIPNPKSPAPNPRAVAILKLHKHKGVPWEPAGHGFIFQKTAWSSSPSA